MDLNVDVRKSMSFMLMYYMATAGIARAQITITGT